MDNHHEFAVSKYLTQEAIDGYKNLAASTIIQKDDKVTHKCAYFSCVVKPGNEEAGIEKMAGIANRLAAEGLFHSHLCQIQSIKLATTTGQLLPADHPDNNLEPLVAIFTFIHIPVDKHDEVMSWCEFYKEEGGVGPRID